MCDPVTCEKCRNVAWGQEAQTEAVTMSGLIDNTAQQVERLASLKLELEHRVSGQTEAMEHPLVGENRDLKASLKYFQEQYLHLSELNSDLTANNRHLRQLLQVIHSTAEAGL